MTSRNQLWLGDGKGGFVIAPNADLTKNKNPTVHAAAADFNNDTHTDVFVVNGDWSGNELWLGDGKGGFKRPQLLRSQSRLGWHDANSKKGPITRRSYMSVLVLDADDNGWPDLLVAGL